MHRLIVSLMPCFDPLRVDLEVKFPNEMHAVTLEE